MTDSLSVASEWSLLRDRHRAQCDVCAVELAFDAALGGRCAVAALPAATLGTLLLRERPLLRWRTDEATFPALGADANLWFAYAQAADRLGATGPCDDDLEEADACDVVDVDIDIDRRRLLRTLLRACAFVRGERVERFVELARRATTLRILPRLSEALKVRLLLISDTNAHAISTSAAALFALGCKVAHSCRANVAYRFVRGALQYRVIRPVALGEPLTFNYLGENVCRDIGARSALLQLTKRFSCHCSLCSEPDRLRALPCEAQCAADAVMLCDPRANGRWRCERCAATFAPEQLADTALSRESVAVSLFEKQEWFSSVTQLLAAATRAEKLVGALHWSVAVQHRKVMRNVLQLEAANQSADQGMSASELRDRILQKTDDRDSADSANNADNGDDDAEYEAYVAAMNDQDVRSHEPSGDEAEADDGLFDDSDHLRIANDFDDDNDSDNDNDSSDDDGVPLSGVPLLHRAADSGMIWARWAMHCDRGGALATTAATAMQELYTLLVRLDRLAEAARVARHFVEFYAVEWTAGGGGEDRDDSDSEAEAVSSAEVQGNGDSFVAEARALVAQFAEEPTNEEAPKR
jgi:hypothetical protein